MTHSVLDKPTEYVGGYVQDILSHQSLRTMYTIHQVLHVYGIIECSNSDFLNRTKCGSLQVSIAKGRGLLKNRERKVTLSKLKPLYFIGFAYPVFILYLSLPLTHIFWLHPCWNRKVFVSWVGGLHTAVCIPRCYWFLSATIMCSTLHTLHNRHLWVLNNEHYCLWVSIHGTNNVSLYE